MLDEKKSNIFDRNPQKGIHNQKTKSKPAQNLKGSYIHRNMTFWSLASIISVRPNQTLDTYIEFTCTGWKENAY